MKRLFASAAIVAIAAIGIPVASAVTASAAAPQGFNSPQYTAWAKTCTKDGGRPAQSTDVSWDCFGIGSPGPASPARAGICTAAGGVYEAALTDEDACFFH